MSDESNPQPNESAPQQPEEQPKPQSGDEVGFTAKLDRTFGFREGETATASAIRGLGEGNDGKKLYDLTLADGSSYPGAHYVIERDMFSKVS